MTRDLDERVARAVRAVESDLPGLVRRLLDLLRREEYGVAQRPPTFLSDAEEVELQRIGEYLDGLAAAGRALEKLEKEVL